MGPTYSSHKHVLKNKENNFAGLPVQKWGNKVEKITYEQCFSFFFSFPIVSIAFPTQNKINIMKQAYLK